MKITSGEVFDKAVSYMGLKGEDGEPMPAASLYEASAPDAINAAIVYSSDVNQKLCGKPIIPSGVSESTDRIEVCEKVAETILPLKTAVIISARYDTELSMYLDRMCESFRNDLMKCRKAFPHPISEEYR